MKLRSVITVLLVLILLVSTVAGCDSKEKETDNPSGSSSSDTTQSDTDTKEPSVEPSEESSEEPVTLTILMDGDSAMAGVEKVFALAEEMIGVKIDVEIRAGGAIGDNIVKTRLASGEMADLCLYNSGSLLEALNPAEYFIDISGQPWVEKLDDTYRSSVSVDGKTYGVPRTSAQAGAILYSKTMYADLGLEVPKTWDEFMANCDVIQAAGKTAILGSLADSWTAQVFFLGDHYNVASADSNFALDFEAGVAKYATHPTALKSWEKLEETVQYYNADAMAVTYNDGCDMMVNGEAGHWAMLTQSLSNMYQLYGDQVNDVGVFGIPGDDPNDQGLTVWMPSSIYGNKLSDKQDAILKFMEFYISDVALDAYLGEILPDGPFLIKGHELPDSAYDAVKYDMQSYFDAGRTETALEFQTPVKGPNCPAISQELATGQTTALQAAQAYDDDCLKQAIQLGLNWE